MNGQQGYNPYSYQPAMPYGVPVGGMPYGAAPQNQMAALNNFLTPEQMAEIQQYPQQFPTKLTKDEFLRSICTHKSNGRITLEQMNDGQHHCTICSKDFFLYQLDTPDETIYGICKNLHDLLQSIKTYMLGAPDALKDIYMMLGFIEKLPLLWKSAVKTFEQASNATAFGLQQGNNQDTFQMLGAVMGGGMMGGMGPYYGQHAAVPPMAIYQQPGYGAQYGAPMMPAQAPIPGATQMAAPQPPVYGQTPGYGFNQPYAAQPQAPIPPAMYSAPSPPPGYPNSNPVGYVENPGVAQTQVNISPMAPGQTIPLPPDPPVNPNLQSLNEKADVNKVFQPAS